ncbi:MAG: ferritin family protein [Deltaproteobacteria bacterium]|nr:ferritin family protein [Deltaproteobacteria bacterium]
MFNAEEIFQIAIQIERNGRLFYQRAAELFDGETKRTLLGLADMEESHERFFTQLKQALFQSESAQAIYDPDGEVEKYLAAIAGSHIFDLNQSSEETWEAKSSIDDILKLAIEREKESVVYYVGLKGIVPEKLGKEKIEDIIKEEMGHIAFLAKTRLNLKKRE